MLATCGYGVYRLGQNNFGYGPRIALIQGNLDQRIRNDSSLAREAGNHFINLCNFAARDSKGPVCGMVGGSAAQTAAWLDGPSVDLVVWPETSYPMVWKEEKPGVPTDYCEHDAAWMAAQWNTRVLLGVKSSIPENDGRRAEYNTALLLYQGKAIDRYDKIHLVPLGEYVPFRQTFPILKKLAPYDFDYSVDSGRKHTRFPLQDKLYGNGYTFGVVICYEDTDPDVARPYGGGDGVRPADFILNTSNDGWFNGTSEHEQHLAISRFRAIECRRSVGRSVNMGVSALIDPNGHVLPPRELSQIKSPSRDGESQIVSHIWVVDQPSWGHDLPVSRWGEFKKVQGVMFAAVPIDDRTSFYARVGDWLPWTCWSALAVGMFAGMIRRLRRV
jgi:apolipoprotein N-acyltransferase